MNNYYPRVTVVLSSYNGGGNIERQLDSIIAQKNVEVSIIIRDDGSKDDTAFTIEHYILKHPDNEINLIKGQNVGYAQSFMEALRMSGESEYFAFSDQDDIWDEYKLIKCFQKMELDKAYSGPKMAYCKMRRLNSDLEEYPESPEITPADRLTKKIALTKIYAKGASIVMNSKAKALVCRCDVPQNVIKCGGGHDAWAGVLCVWFGKVYFVDEELYSWIRYETSVTGSGTRISGYKYLLHLLLSGKSYMNVAETLLKNYVDLLTEDEKIFLIEVCNYKKNIISRVKLFLDSEFVRDSMKGTIILKLSILCGIF